MTLHFRDPRGATIRYDIRAGAKTIRYSVNVAKNKRNRFGIHGLIIYFFCFTPLSNGAKPIETVSVENLSL